MSLAVRPNSHKRMYASTAVNNDSAVHREVNGAQEMQHSTKPIMRVWEVMSSCIIHSLRSFVKTEGIKNVCNNSCKQS